MVIFKYPVDVKPGEQTVRLPKSAVLVHAGPDGLGIPCLWARVDEDEATEEKRIRIVATGEPYEKEWTHMFTWMQRGFVWHMLVHKSFYEGWVMP